ncbi:hypothetical protein KC335_g137 [Hortaea werneckii]|nr:hypothetical protein KC335_g137 [Hortaea werneckii]
MPECVGIDHTPPRWEVEELQTHGKGDPCHNQTRPCCPEPADLPPYCNDRQSASFLSSLKMRMGEYWQAHSIQSPDSISSAGSSRVWRRRPRRAPAFPGSGRMAIYRGTDRLARDRLISYAASGKLRAGHGYSKLLFHTATQLRNSGNRSPILAPARFVKPKANKATGRRHCLSQVQELQVSRVSTREAAQFRGDAPNSRFGTAVRGKPPYTPPKPGFK